MEGFETKKCLRSFDLNLGAVTAFCRKRLLVSAPTCFIYRTTIQPLGPAPGSPHSVRTSLAPLSNRQVFIPRTRSLGYSTANSRSQRPLVSVRFSVKRSVTTSVRISLRISVRTSLWISVRRSAKTHSELLTDSEISAVIVAADPKLNRLKPMPMQGNTQKVARRAQPPLL